VETEDQRARLAQLGCDEMQGYLLSQPLPASAFEQRFLRAAAPSGAAVSVPVP
jgi:EAL domain-containing protein (putative c-di-GMP-specific phosphodiesterase class I)